MILFQDFKKVQPQKKFPDSLHGFGRSTDKIVGKKTTQTSMYYVLAVSLGIESCRTKWQKLVKFIKFVKKSCIVFWEIDRFCAWFVTAEFITTDLKQETLKVIIIDSSGYLSALRNQRSFHTVNIMESLRYSKTRRSLYRLCRKVKVKPFWISLVESLFDKEEKHLSSEQYARLEICFAMAKISDWKCEMMKRQAHSQV